MASIQHLKAVLFDWDDTLTATHKAKFSEHKFIAQKYYGITLTDVDIKAHWGIAYDKLVCALYNTSDVDQAMAYIAKHEHDYPKMIFSDTIKILSMLREWNLLTGIVTAHSLTGVVGDMERLGVTSLVDYVQGYECSLVHKPDPGVFDPTQAWLREKGVERYEVLYVGDGLHDLHAARGHGYNFVGVQTGFVSETDFQSYGVKSVRHIGELLSLIS